MNGGIDTTINNILGNVESVLFHQKVLSWIMQVHTKKEYNKCAYKNNEFSICIVI
jgi:hypothetical protein